SINRRTASTHVRLSYSYSRNSKHLLDALPHVHTAILFVVPESFTRVHNGHARKFVQAGQLLDQRNAVHTPFFRKTIQFNRILYTKPVSGTGTNVMDRSVH